jgi:hypothetical protein
MAFTASVMPRILYEVNEIYQSPTTVDARYAQEPASAPALLTRQTSRAVERLTNGSCVGISVWFYDAGASNTVYEGSTPDSGLSCDNAACGEGQTAAKDYDNNIFFNDCKAAVENRCNNELEFAQESARVLYHLMYQMRLSLNKKIINTLMAAAQQNQTPAAQMPAYIDERVGSNILQIDKDNMTDTTIWQTLVDLNILSVQNGLSNPIFLNGRNFLNARELATFNALNDDQRSQLAIFQSLGRNMVWDIHTSHGVDAITTELSTLAITPNAYMFWNWTAFPEVPVLKDGSINLWQFSIADPYLTYNDGGVTKRVMYDVEHTYECTGYDASGQRTYTHSYRIFLRGGFALAPIGFNMAGTSQVYTGTMHYVVNADSGS